MFHLNMRISFFTIRVTEHWNKLLGEDVEPFSLEMVKIHLDAFLCNML